MNLARVITQWARQRPDAVAIHFLGRDISYAQLDSEITGAAALLHRQGVRHGDRVAFLGFNHPHTIALLFALARIGAMLVPLNFRLVPTEHLFQLSDCSPTLLIHEAGFDDHVAELAAQLPGLRTSALERDWLAQLAAAPIAASAAGGPIADPGPSSGTLADDLLLVYTSGTTGKPKGAVLTQNALLWNCINSIHAHDLSRHDHVLTVLPIFHVGGLNILFLPALYVGATTTLQPRFDPGDFLHDVAHRKPTLTVLVPATLSALNRHPDWPRADLSSLRMINTGSSVIPASLIEPWHARGIPVGQVYGSTETCPIAICLRPEDAYRKLGSAGRAAMHCEIRLVGEDGHDVAPGTVGEIWARGPNIMRAYFGQPEATANAMQDGWYKTGDLARQDQDGYYWVVGRSRDLIISGGENIYPAELETILADCAAIAESAVVGLPDERWGEVPVAVIVPQPGSAIDAGTVLALFEGRLARFKHPKRVVFVDELPKTALGKVQKAELFERLRG